MDHHHRHRLLVGAAFSAGCIIVLAAAAPAAAASARPFGVSAGPAAGFRPPLPLPLTVLRGFAAPAQPWLPGNRGVDLAATAGAPVFAAVTGRVLYAGELAGRGVISIVSFASPDLRTTYEPVTPIVDVGETVEAGELIGHVADVADDCGPRGSCLHWGVIRGATYLDPMRLLGRGRVRLLPIWLDPPGWLIAPRWFW